MYRPNIAKAFDLIATLTVAGIIKLPFEVVLVYTAIWFYRFSVKDNVELPISRQVKRAELRKAA